MLPFCWQFSCFQERYIINLFVLSISLVNWQCLKVDYVWVRKQQLSRKDQVPYSLTAQTLELGLHSVCSGVYKDPGPLHCMCFELTILQVRYLGLSWAM